MKIPSLATTTVIPSGMPINEKYLADFKEDTIFHIYNRTNNKELLFRTDNDRITFLNKYDHYFSPLWDTFSWSLLPNHFHWLVRIKPAHELCSILSSKKEKDLLKTERQYLEGSIGAEQLIEKACQRFFTSYAMFFNKTYQRKGNLFHRPFKRIEVNKDSQFTQAIVYIHANALKHNIVSDFTKYKWSSWQSLLSNAPTRLLREELLEWFGGKEAMIKIHLELSQYYRNSEISIEE